ncbi:major facilitator superfamily domain-containing protein [Zychaea mexicana]|uniref:major facilitator superfamily domain-containing protein n=1 Tax=Zychaea mexicana TaxID=64656 RepID=UPI0022FE46DE|nr:major facilitator superfamily domain-containing protein [Zychaea mexicana]KAI9494083.1 major facilitator superfamily domain-containing protein [Zychaea mexicana]
MDMADVSEYKENDPNRIEKGLPYYNNNSNSYPSTSSSPTIVSEFGEDEWEADDPANPYNWSKLYRWVHTLIVSSLVISVAFGSSVISGDQGGVMSEFNVSSTVTALQVSLMVCGFGVGPILWSPLSETIGRKPVYIIAIGIYVIFNIPCALAPNIGTILVCRFIAGFFASVVLTLAGGSISDIFKAEERGAAIAYFAAAPYAGPVLGPIVGGWVFVGTQSWRWIYWVNMIFSGVMWIVICFLPETYGPVLLRRRRGGTLSEALRKNFDLQTTLVRPFTLLLTEPILFLMSLYIAIIYALLYGFFGCYPIIFGDIWGMNSGFVGLMFLGVMVGVALALFITPQFEKRYIKSNQTPEDRLPGMMFSAPFIPISLFIFGWTSHAHWAGPMCAGIPFGFGMVLVYYAANNYIIDCFSQYCASALAAKTIIRSGGGAAFPLFVGPLYRNLGSQWASSLLAFISLAIIPIPFVFYKWGPQIRAKSHSANTSNHPPPPENLEKL